MGRFPGHSTCLQRAVAYGEQATAIFANGDTLDTLACAYALSGDFSKAIDTEMRAINVRWVPQGSDLTGDLQLLEAHQQCKDPTFGWDKDSFRQAAIIPLSTRTKAGDAVRAKF
jgi:hypothetical protein